MQKIVSLLLVTVFSLSFAPAYSAEQHTQAQVLLDPRQRGTFEQKMHNFQQGFLTLLDRYASLRGHGGAFSRKERAIKVVLISIGTSMNMAIQGYNEGALSQDDLSTILMVQMARCQQLIKVHPELGP